MDIKLLVMDVDGTLTDGKIYMSSNGELMKAFNIKDGYAIAHLREHGIEPVIITGRESDIVKQRCKELGITEFHQGVGDKLFCLRAVCKIRGVKLSQVAYIGDDVNDFLCIQQCGHSACPSDAVKSVRERVDYVCENRGGEGAVREYVEFLLEEQNSSLGQFDESNTFQEIKYEVEPIIID